MTRLTAGGRLTGREALLGVLGLLAATVLLRAQDFGNPVIHIDEQFYLLVGDRMLHGAVPYVDIWDRKPIGLFLIYAAARLLGGHGVVQYQILAALFAWASAVVIARMALALTSHYGAMCAGVIYLMLLCIAEGAGGQAPVFYNLPVALAAALTGRLALRARPAGAGAGAGERGLGCVVMLLVGVAMQIKYNAMFEGIGFGLVLLWSRWRRGAGLGALALDAAAWIGCALAPTAAALAAYAAIGRLDAFVFANFVSILNRGHGPPLLTAIRLGKIVAMVAPLIIGISLGRDLAEPPADARQRLARRLAVAWFALACGSVLMFGSYFTHYALPLAGPGALAAAPFLGGNRQGRFYGAFILIAGLGVSQYAMADLRHRHGEARRLNLAVAAVRSSRNCPYVYDGYPLVYYETGACFPTLRPFPAHQQQTVETFATGQDQTGEVARIMSRRPDRVMSMEPAYPEENLRSRRALYSVLRRDYRVVESFRTGRRRAVIYALKPGIAPLPNRVVAEPVGSARR